MLEIHVAPGDSGRHEYRPIRVPINAFTTLDDVENVVRANDPEKTTSPAYMQGVPLLFHITGVPAKDVTMKHLRETAARHWRISFSYDTDYVWNTAFAARAAARTAASGGKTARRRRVRSVRSRVCSVRSRVRSVRRRVRSVHRRVRSVRRRRG
jgi:hypothetical protein